MIGKLDGRHNAKTACMCAYSARHFQSAFSYILRWLLLELPFKILWVQQLSNINYYGLNILCDASEAAAAAASVCSHNRECQLVSRQFLEDASDIVPESSEFTPLHSTALALLPDEIPVRSRTLDALFSPRNLAISGR